MQISLFLFANISHLSILSSNDIYEDIFLYILLWIFRSRATRELYTELSSFLNGQRGQNSLAIHKPRNIIFIFYYFKNLQTSSFHAKYLREISILYWFMRWFWWFDLLGVRESANFENEIFPHRSTFQIRSWPNFPKSFELKNSKWIEATIP